MGHPNSTDLLFKSTKWYAGRTVVKGGFRHSNCTIIVKSLGSELTEFFHGEIETYR